MANIFVPMRYAIGMARYKSSTIPDQRVYAQIGVCIFLAR